MQVSFAPAVPVDAPVVVRSKRSTRALYVVMLIGVVLGGVVIVALPALAFVIGPAMLPLLSVMPLQLIQLWLAVRIAREYQGLLGPQLAAGPAGVWVRTGTGRRPEVVYLPWSAIDGVDAIRKGPIVRIMSRQGEDLFPKRTHWRVRTLRRRFGTSFVVDGRRSAQPPDAIVHRLHGVTR
jgi:hypothetical protein